MPSRTLLTLTLLLGATSAAAADEPPTRPRIRIADDSPARRNVERCLEQVARVPSFGAQAAVGVAERAGRLCGSANRRDESVDVRPLVRYQQAMLAWAQARVARESTALDRERALDQRVRRLMAADLPTHELEAATRAADALVAEARAIAAALSEGPPPPSLPSYREHRRRAAAAVATELSRLDARMESGNDVQGAYGSAIALAAEWEAASLILRDEAAVTEAHRRVARWKSQLPPLDVVERVRADAETERARQRRFPAAVAREPATERTMRRVFEAQGWNETVLALRLTSGWADERNPAGVVTGRRRDAAIGVRLGDGTCRVYDFTFYQPRSGSGWGDMRRSSHASMAIACENVPRE